LRTVALPPLLRLRHVDGVQRTEARRDRQQDRIELHEGHVRCAMGLVAGVTGRRVRDLAGASPWNAKKPQPPLHKRIRLRLLVGLTHLVSP
jgi:hypothetical protein